MPAPALVATVGAADSNSYATVADATAHLNERLNASAWTAAVTAAAGDPERALIQATRLLDREEYEGEPVLPIVGTSTGATQALKWPRYSADNADGWIWEPTLIPAPVRHATYELALYLLNQGTTDPTQPTGLEGFENVVVGALEVTPRQGFQGDGLPENVRKLLAPVLRTSRSSVRLWRA